MAKMTKTTEIIDNITKNTSLLHVKSAKDKLDKSPIINILVNNLPTYMILNNINLQNRQNQL
jgi:hypothetical protein